MKVKVIELPYKKLDPKAKYIFLLSPEFSNYNDGVIDALHELIGANFVVFPFPSDAFKVYEVLPEKKK